MFIKLFYIVTLIGSGKVVWA